MRWGIFWRKLLFSLDQVGSIIHASFLLHNFIIDQKTAADNKEDERHFRELNVANEDRTYLNRFHHEQLDSPLPLVTDNGAVGGVLRALESGDGNEEAQQRLSELRGTELRDSLAVELHATEQHRFYGPNVEFNRYGNAYTLY
jgi:hypothetical protein